MAETILLDPDGIAVDRQEFDITPFVREQGPDFGDAALEPYMAELARGSMPVDFRVPNRVVQIPIQVLQRTGVTFEQARARIQAKVALFQQEGGWVSRQTAVGTLYADVVTATLKFGGSGLQAHGLADADAVLTLECLPDWYGDEVTLTQHTETTNPELIFTEADIAGNYPARCRLVVEERDADSQLGLLWGFRSRHYSADAEAALAYDAEDLDPLDTASVVSNEVKHTDLGTGWTPVCGTNIGGTDFLTHTGTYRVWARVYSANGDDVDLRFVWDVGDLALPVENSPWTFPGASSYYLADLGEIRLDRIPVGAHRWQGQIQGRGDVGGEDVQIRKLYFQPLDEAAGRLSVVAPAVDGLVDFSARDEFNQSAGALTGKTLPVGGTWTVVANSDADDFAVSGSAAQRTAVSDAGTGSGAIRGRAVSPGTTAFSLIAAQVDFKSSVFGGAPLPVQGVFARLVDSANHLAAYSQPSSSEETNITVIKTVAGVSSGVLIPSRIRLAASSWYSIRLVVDTAGRWWVWLKEQGVPMGAPLLSGQDSALATGGTLATGRAGFFDYSPSAIAATRDYDNFKAWVPTLDAVLHASQSCEISTDGCFREDSAGAAYGPVSHVQGDLPRLPVAGMEDRTVEVFVKASRGDLDQLPDAGIDDIRATVAYRPCYLFVPAA